MHRWWYQCRASFFLALERLFTGFPTLWSPNEEFFRQCEELVHKRAFQRDIAIKFYLIDARKNTRLDLQPYLLEDLRVETAFGGEHFNLPSGGLSSHSDLPEPSSSDLEKSVSKARLAAAVPNRKQSILQSGQTEVHTHRVVTLFIPLNVIALTEKEASIDKRKEGGRNR